MGLWRPFDGSCVGRLADLLNHTAGKQVGKYSRSRWKLYELVMNRQDDPPLAVAWCRGRWLNARHRKAAWCGMTPRGIKRRTHLLIRRITGKAAKETH